MIAFREEKRKEKKDREKIEKKRMLGFFLNL